MKHILLTTILVLGTLIGFSQSGSTTPAVTENQTSDRDLPNGVQSGGSFSRNQVRMYPNPTNGGITIEGFVVNNTSRYTICDATGRTVASGTLTTETHTLDVSYLLNGMYFVTFKGGHETVVLRLVKQ
ncbi:MAG: T9SS type A sorting domain-containing protein [Flavobacteriales bacterium]